jgi:hypothetical protein
MPRSAGSVLVAFLLAITLIGCATDASCLPWTCQGAAPERPDLPNQAVAADIRVAALERTKEDAIGTTRQYLAAMRREIASPQIHVPANVTAVWAVPAMDAWTIDPCIPRQSDAHPVWITRGVGDYLNLHDFAWSRHFGQFDAGFALACQGAAASGTVVVDDASGEILGIFPGEHDGLEPPPSQAPG